MKSKTILTLRLLEKEMKPIYGTEVFVVGSYVRDVIRKKKPQTTMDIVIRHLSFPNIKKFLSKYGETKMTIYPEKELVFKAHGDETVAKIKLSNGSRKKDNSEGTASLKQDAQQKSFALDAMYLPINALTPARVIDYVGGRSDVAAKQILSIGNAATRFRKHPEQIMRAFSLSATTGYSINNHVRSAIAECATLLKKVPPIQIREELVTILTSTKPSVPLRLMLKLGVLDIILPELSRCNGCLQDGRYHKYDVFTHLLYTCDNIDNNIVLRLAGLLHDIGKPESIGTDASGKTTFYRHEMFGAKTTSSILHRFGFDQHIIDQVSHLVRMHMYHYTRDYTDSGVNRFITAAGINETNIDNLDQFPLFKLREAERLGNGFKKSGVTPRQKEFQERIIRVFKTNSTFAIKNLEVDGGDIIKLFNIEPGPEIGDILRHLLTFVNEDRSMNERKILLHCALDYILDKKENCERKG